MLNYLCDNKDVIEMIISIVTLGLAIVTLGLAGIAAYFTCTIPYRVRMHNIYSDLVAEYRKPEMGEAVLALFNFYQNCQKYVLDINKQYGKIYDKQIRSKLEGNNIEHNILDFSRTLHFQRRLVAQFYASMAEYFLQNKRKRSCLGNCLKKLEDKYFKLPSEEINYWFTKRELELLKMLLELDEPASQRFINIDEIKLKQESYKPGMYKDIYDLYEMAKGAVN